MTSLLSGALAAAVYSGLKSLFLDATIERDVLSSSPDFDPSDPPPASQVTFSCKAIKDNYSAFDLQNKDIIAGDAKILILANSLAATPQPNDRVTVQGQTFAVINSKIDPANALWECQGRQ